MRVGSEPVSPREFGRKIKFRNAVTAWVCGGVLTAGAYWASPHGVPRMLAGFVLGWIYANAFEYCLHRFVLHAPEGLLSEKHGLHHSSFRTEEEPVYTNFAHSPWVVVLLFAANTAPVIAVEWLWQSGIAGGVLAAFTIYFVLYEEIHWRIHMGGLPRGLEFSRRHHLAHHAGVPDRFNVWLPFCDRLAAALRRR